MTHRPAAPSQADAPPPWARAILHARIPAALKLLLLALLAAFPAAGAARGRLRAPRADWFISAHTNPNEEADSPQDWHEQRRLRRARAELGWLLRGTRNRGMAPRGSRAPVLRLAQPARAPPWPAHVPPSP